MPLDVRPARASEVDEAGRLTLAAYSDSGFVEAGSEYAGHLRDAASRARDAELYVAVDDATVLGTVTFCRPGTPFAELARPDEGEFRMLAVAAHARRRGVAQALVTRCVERTRELGLSGLVLCSMREMADAHRLYRRLGFRRDPARDWSPAEGVDLLAFHLPTPIRLR